MKSWLKNLNNDKLQCLQYALGVFVSLTNFDEWENLFQLFEYTNQEGVDLIDTFIVWENYYHHYIAVMNTLTLVVDFFFL